MSTFLTWFTEVETDINVCNETQLGYERGDAYKSIELIVSIRVNK